MFACAAMAVLLKYLCAPWPPPPLARTRPADAIIALGTSSFNFVGIISVRDGVTGSIDYRNYKQPTCPLSSTAKNRLEALSAESALEG